jgi:hypothetical protein
MGDLDLGPQSRRHNSARERIGLVALLAICGDSDGRGRRSGGCVEDVAGVSAVSRLTLVGAAALEAARRSTLRSAVPNNGRGLRRRAAGRVGKRFFRTPVGALLLEHAGHAFAELEAAQEGLRQLRGWWRGGCALYCARAES